MRKTRCLITSGLSGTKMRKMRMLAGGPAIGRGGVAAGAQHPVLVSPGFPDDQGRPMVRRVGNTVSYGTSRMVVGDDPRIGSWWGGPVEGDDLGIGGHDESLSLRPGGMARSVA